MHIEKRKLGKRTKYFLAHSYREGSQVHKFRKYLGQDLKPSLFDEREKIAEKLILEEIHKYMIIRDPLQISLDPEEIKSIRKLEAPLRIHHLSEGDWKEFSKLFTYNTNAIEGSKLSLTDVQQLLENDKWPDQSKEDIAEAQLQRREFFIDFIEMLHITGTDRQGFKYFFWKEMGRCIFRIPENPIQ